MQVEHIYTYPIKSTKSNSHETIAVKFHGLQYDRNWAIIDKDNQVITARDYPTLLEFSALPSQDEIKIYFRGEEVAHLGYDQFQPATSVKVFKEEAIGYTYDENVNAIFTRLLGIESKLLYMGPDFARPVDSKYGGIEGDVLNYADECPILLVSTASLQDLNSRLTEEVTMARFRPNITIKGCFPYQEDAWKKIKIGACEFRVAQACKRCVFTTIDPETLEKSPEKEPLRTLATYKKHPSGGGVAFGVHLIPTKIGNIKLDDALTVIA